MPGAAVVTVRPPAPDGRVRVPGVAGIVLAGGRSSRFGSDKLAAPYAGGTLLEAAIRSVAAVTDEVVVTIPPDGPEPSLPDDLGLPVRVVRDIQEGGGPLAALPEALRATAATLALVVAGDTPRLPPDVARLLLGALADPGPARPGLSFGRSHFRTTAVALLVDGSFQPLPLALRREQAEQAAIRLLAGGESSLRALLVALGATGIPEVAWRAADPAGSALRDVDTQEDLADLH
jgi:molybdopterin-guanine dinucleotide biosynthesis protein A